MTVGSPRCSERSIHQGRKEGGASVAQMAMMMDTMLAGATLLVAMAAAAVAAAMGTAMDAGEVGEAAVLAAFRAVDRGEVWKQAAREVASEMAEMALAGRWMAEADLTVVAWKAAALEAAAAWLDLAAPATDQVAMAASVAALVAAPLVVVAWAMGLTLTVIAAVLALAQSPELAAGVVASAVVAERNLAVALAAAILAVVAWVGVAALATKAAVAAPALGGVAAPGLEEAEELKETEGAHTASAPVLRPKMTVRSRNHPSPIVFSPARTTPPLIARHQADHLNGCTCMHR